MLKNYYKWVLRTVCNNCDTIAPTASPRVCPQCGVGDDHRWIGVEYVFLADDTKFQTGWVREKKVKNNKIHRVRTFKEACRL